jgi:serine/threonine protein kinase
LYWYGVQHNYHALVADVYGPSLENLLKFCYGKFTLKTTLLIMDQLVDRIQWIHSKNLVYNDIDSENFLVGLGKKADKIFIVDFGNSRKFVD